MLMGHGFRMVLASWVVDSTGEMPRVGLSG